MLRLLLTSQIIARGCCARWSSPVLVSTIGVGLTFQVLMDPSGLINNGLALVGINGWPGSWIPRPPCCRWPDGCLARRGAGHGDLHRRDRLDPREYFEAAASDGATAWRRFWKIVLPLSRPAITTVIILALIGGLRSFDLIWAMTRGGPGSPPT